MMKRLLSCVMVLAMLLSDVPASALQREAEVPEGPVSLTSAATEIYTSAAAPVVSQSTEKDSAADPTAGQLPTASSEVTPDPAVDPGTEDPAAGSGEEDPAVDPSTEDPAAGSGEEDPAAEAETDPLKLSITKNPTDAALSTTGTARFTVSASLTGEGASSYSLTYAWQYCSTSDSPSAVESNPSKYEWKNVSELKTVKVTANKGTLTVSSEKASAFDNLYFRCVVNAGNLSKASKPAIVDTVSKGMKAGDEGDPCVHQWQYQKYFEPTCEEQGYNADYCPLCGAIASKNYVASAPKHGSDLDWEHHEQTCKAGYIRLKCNKCGAYTVRADSRGDGTGSHVFENGVCIVPGCGEHQQHTTHTWDNGDITTPATCGTPGVKTYHCTFPGCTETRTEVIPSTGNHDWVEGETVLPTCTEEGYTPYTCSVCNLTKHENTVSALGHTPGEWVIVSDATCTDDGEEKRECSVCHAEDTVETRVISALGHGWNDGEKTKDATCTQEGEMTYTCRTCEATSTEEIPMKDHTRGSLIETVPATCQRDGHETYECSVCHNSFDIVLPQDESAHNWTEWTATTPATCQTEGLEQRSCQNEGCTAKETHTLPVDPDAHDWSDWQTVTQPTCQTAGLEKRSCQNEGCTAEETRDIDPIDHVYVDDVCYYCHLSYPKTEQAKSMIDALPNPEAVPSEITVKNADAILASIADIDALIDSMTEIEKTALNNVYPDEVEKLEMVRNLCNALLAVTTYEPQQGESVFTLQWNDNTTTDVSLRTSADSFLTAANASLSYTIKSSDGTETVASGTIPLTGASDVLREAFGFLYDDSYIFPDSPLSCTAFGDNAYQITTDELLPQSYTATYTDYSTMEEVTESFVISYKLTIVNPASANYVYTLPDSSGSSVTVDAGKKAILTKLADWEASVYWMDDNNRSASGGDTFADDSPRVSADVFKNGTEVYVYQAGSSSSSSTVVTREYGYSVDGTETGGNSWTVSLTGLPAYDNDGNLLNYYIKQNDNHLDAANGNGNYYIPTFYNYGNYASKMDSLYDGGTMYEYLTNYIPFTVSKVWDDGNAFTRPSATLYVWRVTEVYDASGNLTVDTSAAYAIPNTEAMAVPTTDAETGDPIASGTPVVVNFGQSSATFPMYDSMGRRYVYYGVEKGLTGSYQLTIDNRAADSRSRNSDAVIDKLSGTRYFINGATLYNAPTEYATPSIEKKFTAASLQNIGPMSATFLLQKKDTSGNWVNATEDDILSASSAATVTADSVTVTLSNFSAESMTDSAAPVTVKFYDENYQPLAYRWVEISVSVNGGTATMDASNWNSGSYNGDIVLNEGNAQSGPENTTVLFNASMENGTVTNTLIGDNQVQVKKYWYDMYGNSIADPSKVTDPAFDISNATARFRIVRSDGKTTEDGSLTDINGQSITDIFLTVEDLYSSETETDYWTRLLDLPRYDENGGEYYYTVQELSVDGLREIGWLKDQKYETQYYQENGIWKKRTISIHRNTMGGSGSVLTFDVTKLWQDGSNTETRKPVNVRIYRFRNALGELLSTPVPVTGTITLSNANNWYQLQRLAGADMVDVETGVTVADTVKNYLVLEIGISADGNNVPIVRSGSMDAIFTDLSTHLNSNRPVGTVGSENAVGSSWDGLDYVYNVSERINDMEKQFENSCASYTITNTRAGLQDYELTKTWNAGSVVKGGEFALYNGDTRIAQFTVRKETNSSTGAVTLVFDPATDYTTSFDQDPASDYSSAKAPVFTYEVDGATGNYKAHFTIADLPKFNRNGGQNNMSIREINMIDDTGHKVSVTSGSATVDGDHYSVSVSSSVEYAEKEYHRSGDVYSVSIVNSRSGSYSLLSNKVWRDDHHYVRPDVSFSVKRIPAKGDLLTAVNEQNTAAILSYITSHASSAEAVIKDCYWNTIINDFWWTCATDDVPQYDSEGYPYVYFGTENMSGGGLYEAYYSNLTSAAANYRPVNAAKPGEDEDVSWTQKVYPIEITDSRTGLSPASGNYFLLSDGVNMSGGKYQNYYSATVVNRPENTRTINGTKIWKLPLGWSIPEEEFPNVKVSLYRSTKVINSSDYTDANDYAAAVVAAAELVDFLTEPGKVIDTETVTPEVHYNYSFPSSDAYQLDEFNKWGSVYEYYTIEEIESDNVNFPSSKIVYETNNFSITNVFSPEPPYVEVTVKKVWDISDAQEYVGQIITLDQLDALDLSDAEISLYGSATKNNGAAKIGTDNKLATVTLSPTDEGNVIDSDAGTVTATYTFTTYTDDSGTHKLPYYWITNKPMWYSVTEKKMNGYSTGKTSSATKGTIVNDHVTFLSHREDGSGTMVWYNTEADGTVSSVTNTYIGEKKEATFLKIWGDKYVDNDEYRPDTIALLIHRRSETGTVEEYTDTYNGDVYSTALNNYVLLEKDDNPARSVWASGGHLQNLLKYDPQGKEYTYYVYGESFDPVVNADGTLTLDPEKTVYTGEDKIIGNYVLSGSSDTALTNTFFSGARVTASAKKTWKINTEDLTGISYARFDLLRKMGALPSSIQYILMRKAGTDAWSPVTAIQYNSETGETYTDPAHVTVYEGKNVLGRSVDLSSATRSNYGDLFNSVMNWENLPKYKATNVEYEYAVAERVTWADGTTSSLVTVDTGTYSSKNMTPSVSMTKTDNNFATSLTNTLSTTKVRLAKVWDDNDGRDNTRPDYINLTIKPVTSAAASSFSGTTVKLYANENDAASEGSGTVYSEGTYYSTEWIEVADKSAVNIVFGMGSGNTYEITEELVYDSREQYSATYTQIITSGEGGINVIDEGNNTYTLRIKNQYNPPRKLYTTLTAKKTWTGDANWSDVTRPTIRFQLEYLKQGSSNEWIALTDGTDGTIRNFTADTTQTAIKTVTVDNSIYSATWANMYKYWATPSQDGVAELIHYRVTELPADGSALTGYTPNTSSSAFTVSDQEADVTASASIGNVLKTNTIKVKKTWSTAGTTLSSAQIANLVALDALPYQLNFQLEYKINGTWVSVPYTSTNVSNVVGKKMANGAFSILTTSLANGNIALSTVKLPIYDSTGAEILYRVREVSVQYHTPEAPVPVSSGKAGDITVADSAEESLVVTSGAKLYSLSNSYTSGKVTVEKIWADSNNRDGVRDASVTMELFRDSKTATAYNSSINGTNATDNTDSRTIELLPVYKNGSATEKSQYYFHEIATTNLNAYYTTVYAANGTAKTSYTDAVVNADATTPGKVTVTNTHRSLMAVDASKVWADLNNAYGQRPASVALKLQYSTDGSTWNDVTKVESVPSENYRNSTSTPAADDGTTVFTTSDVTQTISKAEGQTEADSWGTAHWENLPAYVRVSGTAKQIQYRAYDSVTGYNYTFTTATGTNTSKASDAAKTVTATNTAAAKATVTKTWTETNYSWLTRPDSVQVCLEARLKDTDGAFTVVSGSNQDLTSSNSWSASWDKLSDAYEYRVKEISVTYGTTVVSTSGNTESGNVGTYAYTSSVSSATASGITTTTGSLSNTLKTGSLSVDKNWLAENNRDGISSVTFKLKKDGVIMKDQYSNDLTWTITKANNWTLTIPNLPLYKNDAAAQTEDNKCSYEIVEVAIDGVTPAYGSAVKLSDTESKTAQFTNNYTPIRASLTVTKAWNDSENAYGSRPEKLYFKLQYNKAGVWTDVPTGVIGENGLYTVSGVTLPGTDAATTSVPNVTGTVWHEITKNASGTWTYTWTELPVHILNASGVTGNAQYRVLEGVKNGNDITEIAADGVLHGYTVSYGNASVTLTAGQTASTTVTNTLALKPLKVSKTWVEPTGMSSLVRPVSVKFDVEYRLGTGEWTSLPSGISVAGITNSSITLTGNTDTWQMTTGGLPIQTADGILYEYRVKEAVLTYADSTAAASGSYATDGTWNGNAGTYTLSVAPVTSGDSAYTASATNTLAIGSLNLEKIWDDENNRDAGEKAVELNVYRILSAAEGSTQNQLVTTVTLSSDNSWKATLSGLPVYDNSTGEKSVYFVKETGETDAKWTGANSVEYTVTYSANVTLDTEKTTAETAPKMTVTNKHVPYAGSVTAAKTWEDQTNLYQSRPGSITFELQWKDGNTWTTVTKNTEHSASGVYTTSDNPQTVAVAATNTQSLTFAGVPVNIGGSKVQYRIVETYSGSDNTNTGYTVTYPADVTLDGTGSSKDYAIKNTLTTGKLQLSKTWSSNDYLTQVSASFSVWYKIGTSGTWVQMKDANDTPLAVTLNSANSWSWNMTGVPVTDAAGTAYIYGFKETSVTYKVIGPDGVVSDEITVNTVGDNNDSFSGNSWSGKAGCYDASITGQTSGSGANSVFSFTASNTAETGKLALQKNWLNGSNRDNDRGDISVQLYRDGVAYGDPITIADPDDPTKNIWTLEYANLPVYMDDSTGTKSVYTFKEVGEDNGTYTNASGHTYTVSYSAGVTVAVDTDESTAVPAANTLTVSNKRVIDVFNLEVDKHWTDDNNYYLLRDTSADLTIQYSVDNKVTWQNVTDKRSSVPDPEDDDGTSVFTTSALVQTVSGNADADTWGPVFWENLPRNVLVNNVSVTVYYRVVETENSISATGYASTPSKAVCYDDAVLTGGKLIADSGNVENKLEDTVSLKVQKVWDGGGTYSAWPDQVLVTLQVSTNGGSTWSDVESCIDVPLTAADGWTHTFNNLRENPGYSYRAIETAIVYLANEAKGIPEKVIRVSYKTSDKLSGRVGSYDMRTVVTYDEGTALYSVDMTNVFNPVPVSITLGVRKNVVGDERIESALTDFTFILEGHGVRRTVTINDIGTASFGSLSFNRPGTYTYTIREVNGGVEEYTYDTRIRTIVVTVTDTNGVLSVSWTCNGETEQNPVFTNTYRVKDTVDGPITYVIIDDPDVPLGWLPFIGKINLNEGYCFD